MRKGRRVRTRRPFPVPTVSRSIAAVEVHQTRVLVAQIDDVHRCGKGGGLFGLAPAEALALGFVLRLRDLLMRLPNLPLDEVPDGADENDNVEIRRWGNPRNFDFTPVEHFEIAGIKPLGVMVEVLPGTPEYANAILEAIQGKALPDLRRGGDFKSRFVYRGDKENVAKTDGPGYIYFASVASLPAIRLVLLRPGRYNQVRSGQVYYSAEV